MDIEPADLPFRKLEADRKFDAVAYCPICRTTEVQLVKTYTSHWNMIAGTDEYGFRVSVIPRSRKCGTAESTTWPALGSL